MDSFAHKIASLAQRAILFEVTTAPKPGLVDPLDQGAHDDMDMFTFISSGTAIYKGMYRCVQEGMNNHGSKEILKDLRGIGIECEKDMFNATKGVNTHKGIIFSIGLICAGAGILMGKGEAINSLEIIKVVKELTKNVVKDDFNPEKNREELTQGEKFFREYGIKGIRGEASEGFPTVMKMGLPILKKWNRDRGGVKPNDIFLQVLLSIMTHVEDTNIITRGGFEGLKFVRNSAEVFIQDGGIYTKDFKEKLIRMNEIFKEKNISPGGAADLLAVTILLGSLDGIEY